MNLNDNQLRAIKYYEGDVEGDDPFWSEPKAYLVINSLFYEGIETEKARTAEGKLLNPELIRDSLRLYRVIRDLLSAFEPDPDVSKPLYRVERMSDFQQMKDKGRTISFTSTSTGGFLKSYADRKGIVLLEFEAGENTPVLNFAKALNNDYRKEEEQEVLLPPGVEILLEELPLTEEHLRILDSDGHPPAARYLVRCGKPSEAVSPDEIKLMGIFPGNSHKSAVEVLTALKAGIEPDDYSISLYLYWKSIFRQLLNVKTAF